MVDLIVIDAALHVADQCDRLIFLQSGQQRLNPTGKEFQVIIK